MIEILIGIGTAIAYTIAVPITGYLWGCAVSAAYIHEYKKANINLNIEINAEEERKVKEEKV
jgi:hypothetical protein